LAKDQHWYIAFVAVAPSFQGVQYGRSLLERALARADSAGLSCYIETHIEGILGLLESYGFFVLQTFEIPRIDIQYWAMRRDPKRERA
jgi:ribosomal protein S18 acetylase RimI-like enzyme